LFGNLLKHGTLNNLWDSHPPFQIDGNFGGSAGILEMLLQSHLGFLHILPALPKAWSEGELKGVLARGGFEFDIIWQNGELKKLILNSNAGEECNLLYKDAKLSFKTKKNCRYSVVYENGNLKLLN
jgi:alpha-L-fucosidase 2